MDKDYIQSKINEAEALLSELQRDHAMGKIEWEDYRFYLILNEIRLAILLNTKAIMEGLRHANK